MNPYTAGDSLQVLSRAHVNDATATTGDPIVVALHRQRRISPADLRNLYDHAAATHPDSQADLADLAAILASGPAVAAWDGERLVGFVRAVSDGRLVAYVEDVVIDRQYREHGLNNALMTRLLAELEDVAVVNLRGGFGTVPYYARQGFQPAATGLLQRFRPNGAA
jgi:GNAT superfamily N-acetyltransferase